MTDDMVTVPRKQLEDLSRRLAAVEAMLADPPDDDDPLRARFLLFVQRARQREEKRRRP